MDIGGKAVKYVLLLIWVACAPTLVFSQTKEETLADIRQELVFLNTEVHNLNRELSTTSGASSQTGSGATLQRMNALEQELRRITGVVENLQFRIERIVKDANNRLGDMQFRIIELEGGDITNIPDISIIDGGTPPSGDNSQGSTENSGVELATSEQGDFDRAVAAFEIGENANAVAKFDQFLLSYPAGPLSGEAHYWRGEALSGLGDWSNAARAFLESFSGSPSGVKAPKSLYRLGVSLAELGQIEDACATLGEVEIRYPAAAEVNNAHSKMTALNCT